MVSVSLQLTLYYMLANVIALIFIVVFSFRKSVQLTYQRKKTRSAADAKEAGTGIAERDEYGGNEDGKTNANDGFYYGPMKSSSVTTSSTTRTDYEDLGCFWTFIEQLQNRSYIFSAFLVHCWDNASDLGVMYTFYRNSESRTLFGASLFIVLNYRIFSAVSFYRAGRGYRDVILQFLDLQLFVDVYRSSVDSRPTDQLYWIRAMEAVLEAAPQCLLQFAFLYKSSNLFVWFSLFVSLISVIFSLLRYDEIIFLYDGMKYYLVYLTRFTFRLCEIVSRTMVLALLWHTWDGEYSSLHGSVVVLIVLIIEFLFYATLTQFAIPPWSLISFLVTDIDLTLTFEGREGAVTKKLDTKRNLLYQLIFKPVSQMFTSMDENDKTDYALFVEDYQEKMELYQAGNASALVTAELAEVQMNPYYARMKRLLIAPAHYVWRFLESIFFLCIVLTMCAIDKRTRQNVLNDKVWFFIICAICVCATPILYVCVRYFADESKTLERNLIAMVYSINERETDSLIKEVQQLIDAGAHLTQSDYRGNTVIHALCETNMASVLDLVIKQRGPKNVPLKKKNNEGFTPAMMAAMNGSLDCLRILNEVMNLDHQRYGPNKQENLAFIAARTDQVNIIDWMYNTPKLQHLLYEKTQGNFNVCHAACVYNSSKVLFSLLQYGINNNDELCDWNGDNCALIASERGFIQCLLVLFEYYGRQTLEFRGEMGHTSFYRAAVNDHGSTMFFLADHCKVNHRALVDGYGVHIAVACCTTQSLSSLECLAKLKVSFSSCMDFINREDSLKLTLLMLSAMNDKRLLCIHLIRHQCLVNHKNKYGETAAHFAASNGNFQILKILRKGGANFKIKNGLQQTALDKALANNHSECAKFIRHCLADPGNGAGSGRRRSSVKQRR